jgi:hypothetical protein
LASAESLDAIAIGHRAKAQSAPSGIAIGSGDSATAGPQATDAGAIAIGGSTFTSTTGARATAQYAIAIGAGKNGQAGASAGGSYAVAIGNTASAAHGTSVALGAGATTTAANQIRLGTAAEIVNAPGRIVGGAPNSALADASLANSQWTAYLDETGNTLTFKVKYAGGTVKSGTVALT